MDWIIWVVLVFLLVIVFVLPLFTRRKQQTQVHQMLSSIGVGDKIKTVGGIVGTVVKVDQISPVDREFVIETGDDIKSQIRFDMNAVYQVMSKVAAEPTAEEVFDKEEVVSNSEVEVEEPAKEVEEEKSENE